MPRRCCARWSGSCPTTTAWRSSAPATTFSRGVISMVTRRTQKIGETMRHTIGELLQRHVKDPRIGFITITAVRVTPDLSKAHVYYTVLGDEKELKGTHAGLLSAAPFLRTETARRIRMKTIPELE